MQGRKSFGAKPKKSATEYMVDLLAKKDYSTRQLTEKLRAKGYSSEETEAAIDKALEWGYLDDLRVATNIWRLNYEGHQYSVSRILMKLREKGFTADIISKIKAEYDDEALIARDMAVAEWLVLAKFGSRLSAEAEYDNPADDGTAEEQEDSKRKRLDWQTVAAFLFRRGFSDRVCRQVAGDLMKKDR